MSWIIYKHTSPSGKSYIGQTKHSMKIRWRGHIKASKTDSLNVFARAIRKYGHENFIHEILEDNIESQELANEREQYWIAFYDTFNNPLKGYNETSGGKQFELSDLAKGKISEKIITLFQDDDFKDKFLTIQNSPETRKRKSDSMKGLKKTEEHKEKLRQANLGKKATEESRSKMSKSRSRCVYQYDIKNNFIKKYNSIGEASKACRETYPEYISLCCKGKRELADGYIWKYEIDVLIKQ